MHKCYPSRVTFIVISMLRVAKVVFATPGDSSMAIVLDHGVSPGWKVCCGDYE